MPFKSERQRRLLWAKYPHLARRWHETYGTPKGLPDYVGEESKDNTAKQAASLKGEGRPMLTFEEKVIDTLQVAGAALDKAEAADRERQAMEKEAADLIPEAVDSCIRNGRVDAADREKLAESLRDPRKVLKILTKVADHRNVEEASHLGGQVDQHGQPAYGQNGHGKNGHTKRAAVGSVDSPYCGARTPEQKPSDLALFRGLGIM